MNNWKTTLTGIGAAAMSALAAIAALPYTLGDVATVIPPEWKARVTIASLIAAFILRVVNSTLTADASKPATPQHVDVTITPPPPPVLYPSPPRE